MQTRISELLFKHLKNELTAEERVELDQFLTASEENRDLLAWINDHEELWENVKRAKELDLEAVWQKLRYGVVPTPSPPPPVAEKRILGLSYRWATLVAAAVTSLIIISVFYFFSSKKKGPAILTINMNTIPVEYFNAMLKTSSGKVFDLRRLKNSSPLYMSEVWVTDTQLVYRDNHAKVSGMDTLETPKEALYSVRLPDGSTVWLNCASALYYPNSFSGRERLVRLEGEAFFDITEDGRPFNVMANGAEIRVSGTKFNVKAYEKEGLVRTTLFEGSVKIRSKEKTETLKPGEEAVVNSSGGLEKRKVKGDKRNTLAWQKNLFYWNHEPLEMIIADICRWYGVQPVYEGPVYSFSYSTTLNRSRPLKEILGILEANTPFNFKSQGDTLFIKTKVPTGTLPTEPKRVLMEQPAQTLINNGE